MQTGGMSRMRGYFFPLKADLFLDGYNLSLPLLERGHMDEYRGQMLKLQILKSFLTNTFGHIALLRCSYSISQIASYLQIFLHIVCLP